MTELLELDCVLHWY